MKVIMFPEPILAFEASYPSGWGLDRKLPLSPYIRVLKCGSFGDPQDTLHKSQDGQTEDQRQSGSL